MCGSRYILDGNAPLGARALDLREVYPQLLGPLPSRLRGIRLVYTLGYLTCHLSPGFLGVLERLAHSVFHTEVLGRLVKRLFNARVGVDHLLDPRLRFPRGTCSARLSSWERSCWSLLLASPIESL